MTPYEILKRPVITEKSTTQKEANNQLTFEVDRKANKVEIRRAVVLEAWGPPSGR